MNFAVNVSLDLETDIELAFKKLHKVYDISEEVSVKISLTRKCMLFVFRSIKKGLINV